MSETVIKINPIEDYLIANGYSEVIPKPNLYAKPRYKKGGNEVIVCWKCGWVLINGAMTRFRSMGYKKLFELIPV